MERLFDIILSGLAILVFSPIFFIVMILLRFTGEGEQLFGAFVGDRLVAIGGIMQDPYLADPKIGRVRRFFVAQEFRRQGIGHQLLKVIVSQASGCFRRITLRTYTQEGAMFYENAGFTPTDLPDCSHEYVM